MMRVAVCISGQMRSWRSAAPILLKNVIKPLAADVFVHTWSQTGMNTKLSQYLPTSIARAFDPADLRDNSDFFEDGPSNFSKKFPLLYQELQHLTQARKIVSISDISTAYNTNNVIVEDFSSVDLNKNFDLDLLRSTEWPSCCLNGIPMFYKIWACDLLRRKYQEENGFKYDLVIRVRPDFVVDEPITKELSQLSQPVMAFNYPPIEELKLKNFLFDGFAIGDDQGMQHYADLWTKLPIYWSGSPLEGWPPLAGRGNEPCVYYHLREIGAHREVLRPEPPIRRVLEYIDYESCINLIYSGFVSESSDVDILDLVNRTQSLECIHIGVTQGWQAADRLASRHWSIARKVSSAPSLYEAVKCYVHGEYRESSHHFELAETKGQHFLYPDFYVMMGVCLREIENFELAKTYFAEGLKRNYTIGSIHANLGILYERLGALDLARQNLNTACCIESQNSWFKQQLSRMMME